METSRRAPLRVVLFEGTRYPWPLDESRRKQFRLLGELAEIFDVAFSTTLRFRRGRDHAEFYLVPRPATPVVRYVVMFLAGTAIVLWLVLARRVRVIVAKRPYEGFAGACVKRLARLLGIPIVLIVENRGDFEVFLFLQREVRWQLAYRWLMRRTARFALREADLLRAVSHSARRQLESWGCRQPVVVAPGWTDLEVFWAAGERRQARRKGDVLYAGVLVARKGVDHLVEAWARVAARFPDGTLTLIGSVENPAFARALRARVEDLGIARRVRFLPPVTQADLAREMASVDLVVLPTLGEGLPRVVLEAMAVGTPVVATAVSGIPEVIEDGETGLLVPPADPAALADRLSWALDHPDEMAKMASRARDRIRRFDPAGAHVRGYATLFERAVELLRGPLPVTARRG